MPAFSNTAIMAAGFVAVIYPILTIFISEMQRVMTRKNSPYVKSLKQVQITVLPILAVYILLTRVAGIDAFPKGEDAAPLALSALPMSVILTKIVLTAVSIFVINSLLTTLNSFLTSQQDKSSFLANIPGLLLDLFRLAMVLLGAALIVSIVWGADLQGALVGLGVGGIVLGLALQDTLSAVFAGLSMVSTRTFKEGDWLMAGDYEGRVVGMDWRSVTIETEQKILAVVPNSELAQSAFVVESSETMPYGEEVSLFLSYDNEPEHVIDVISRVVDSIPDVLQDPPHEVEVLDYTDKGIEYELMFFVADRGDAWKVRSDFLRRFWYVAKRENLYHSGAQNLHFQTIVPQDVSFKSRFEALSQHPIFDKSQEGLDELVTLSRVEDYGLEEDMITIGDKLTHIFVPISGSIDVIDGAGDILSRIEVGDFYISRALLKGTDSPVTLRSGKHCKAIILDAKNLLAFTDKNPAAADQIEHLIEQRENELARTGSSITSLDLSAFKQEGRSA